MNVERKDERQEESEEQKKDEEQRKDKDEGKMEDDEQAQAPHIRRSVVIPTRDQLAQHEATHLPYQP